MNIFNMKVKNIGFAFVLGLILALVSVSVTKAEGENTSLGNVVPNTTTSNTDGGLNAGVNPTDPANTDNTKIVPPTDRSNKDDTKIVPPTGGSNTDDEGITPTPSPTPTSRSSRSGSSSRTNRVVSALVAPVATPSISVISCPIMNSYMKIGADNLSSEVSKLQVFLKFVENIDVDITGIFDTKTDGAVRAFQAKYLSDIMGPWDATISSGYVYITTLKKINEIACKNVRALTADELVIINAYKERIASIANGTDVSSLVNLEIPEFGTIKNANGESVVKGGNSDQTASAESSKVGGKLANFFRKIFNFLLGR
ncbi:MAG: peptidoglycan-binding domain-containing protein [bacterium]|nr:peptidoglycan-binding domain-containing protein [bacterium]